MSQPLTLDCPDPSPPFIIQTDAGGQGMGAILMQEDAGKWKRIIIASAKFTLTESHYHCNEQKCLAVTWTTKRYRPYIETNHFILGTDITALTWFRQIKDSRSKLARWACLLDKLFFAVEHCSSKNNELVDAFSRHPDPGALTPSELDLERMLPPTRNIPLLNLEETRPTINATNAPTLFKCICDSQQHDSFGEKIFHRSFSYQILSDKGKQFSTATAWDCDHWATPIYHPRTNPTENTWLPSIISTYADEEILPQWLPRCSTAVLNLNEFQRQQTAAPECRGSL